MGIVARCECGKRIGLSDVMAGKMVRCPQCERQVLAPMPGTGATHGATGVAAARKKTATPPHAVISPTVKIAAIIGAVVLIIIAIFYFGPWRVGSEWAAISDQANDQVTDVVLFALQAYESQHGLYNPRKSHLDAQLEGPVSFVPPMMAFSMPKNIIFIGRTNRGKYSGTYNPRTGEIAASIETGGYSVAGLVDVRKATGNFEITGREKDGKPEAEMEGEPLKIAVPKPQDDE